MSWQKRLVARMVWRRQYSARLAKLLACACLLGGVSGVSGVATYAQLRAIAAQFRCTPAYKRVSMPVIVDDRDTDVLLK
jgi:hypothetical protein